MFATRNIDALISPAVHPRHHIHSLRQRSRNLTQYIGERLKGLGLGVGSGVLYKDCLDIIMTHCDSTYLCETFLLESKTNIVLHTYAALLVSGLLQCCLRMWINLNIYKICIYTVSRRP